MQIEFTESLADLYAVKNWIVTADQCEAWSGDLVRFPFVGNSISEDIEFPLHQHYVVRREGKMLAFAQLRNISASNVHIGRLIINPDFRGQGLAAKFLNCLIDEAKGLNFNVTLITLNVLENNLTALKIYAEQGFEQFCFLPPNIIQMRLRF